LIRLGFQRGKGTRGARKKRLHFGDGEKKGDGVESSNGFYLGGVYRKSIQIGKGGVINLQLWDTHSNALLAKYNNKIFYHLKFRQVERRLRPWSKKRGSNSYGNAKGEQL